MTNYEYIRNLPIDEFAQKLTEAEWCDSSCDCDIQCRECILKWLISERKESENQ